MKVIVKISLCLAVLGFSIVYSNSVSNYLIESYNNQMEFVASNMVKTSNPFRF